MSRKYTIKYIEDAPLQVLLYTSSFRERMLCEENLRAKHLQKDFYKKQQPSHNTNKICPCHGGSHLPNRENLGTCKGTDTPYKRLSPLALVTSSRDIRNLKRVSALALVNEFAVLGVLETNTTNVRTSRNSACSESRIELRSGYPLRVFAGCSLQDNLSGGTAGAPSL
jgi:hypothetical protein